MDRYDVQILDLLQDNATLSVGDAAEIVGISKSACWRRIQKLESLGYIRDRVALLNAEKLNLPVTVYVLIKTNKHNESWSEKFRKVVETIPQVLEVSRMSGDLDYLIKAVVPDMKGYDDLYKRLIKADLSDVSSSFVMEEMKHTTKVPLDFVQLSARNEP